VNKHNITASGMGLIACDTNSWLSGKFFLQMSTMLTEEELQISILPCLNSILGDTVVTTHLVQGVHLSAQKMQKPRYFFGSAFSDLLSFSG